MILRRTAPHWAALPMEEVTPDEKFSVNLVRDFVAAKSSTIVPKTGTLDRYERHDGGAKTPRACGRHLDKRSLAGVPGGDGAVQIGKDEVSGVTVATVHWER